MFGIFKKKTLTLKSPLEGEIIDISNVPDAVFSQKMVGDGFAVKPSNGLVKAPCKGKIAQIFPTNHAFGLVTDEGLEILVHIGIDTVELKGEGFTRMAQVGDEVEEGDTIIQVDLDILKAHDKSSITPVVITTPDKVKSIDVKLGRSNMEAALIHLT
ncbi:PTS sugar transporter subunit IIA [Fusibacter sp. JL216-2]|uniref:PTS sugar transporter subunit IIA n=1 Tax=Fusibacter sp. JL216-2 TaxID=3071453 RepID=UPI003D32F153